MAAAAAAAAALAQILTAIWGMSYHKIKTKFILWYKSFNIQIRLAETEEKLG
jgi:hypothetical protein